MKTQQEITAAANTIQRQLDGLLPVISEPLLDIELMEEWVRLLRQAEEGKSVWGDVADWINGKPCALDDCFM